MVDRSQRYAKSAKKEKAKEPLQDKEESGAEKKAEATAGKPPSDMKPNGAIHHTDDGPKGAQSAVYGDVAERHKTELNEMHKRHGDEMGAMHERHRDEHGKMRTRHTKEMAPNAQESDAEGKAEHSGKGPDLGKTRDEGAKGTEP